MSRTERTLIFIGIALAMLAPLGDGGNFRHGVELVIALAYLLVGISISWGKQR